MAKVKRQHYYQWLNDQDTTLFKQLMDVSNSIRLISDALIESWDLTPNQCLKVHEKVIGGLRFEIDELTKIKQEITNRGGVVTRIQRYKL